jgi:DNA-directed RNA polymerase specialized sigma24 family protein
MGGSPPHRYRPEDDRRLYDALAAADFAPDSAEWHELLSVLADYGWAVLRQWLVNGTIHRMAASQGRGGVRGLSKIPAGLIADGDDAHALAVMTVQSALPRFLRSLAEGEWQVDGGANLATYFIGRCLMVFPDVFQRWSREQKRWRTILEHGPDLDAGRPAFACWEDDPALQAVTRIEQEQYVNSLSLEDRALLELSAAGYPTREIAEMYSRAGMHRTESAINTRLSRLRKELRRRRGLHDDAGGETPGGGDDDDR